MAKTLKEILESFDFNRAAIAKQRLQNLRHSGRRVRGARVANLMRAAGLKEEEMEETDLDQLDEVLGKGAAAADWIHDFVHSTNPKFEGKSKKERIRMALGAYYAKQRNEEVEFEQDLDEGLKARLAHIALAGALAAGAHGAHARVMQNDDGTMTPSFAQQIQQRHQNDSGSTASSAEVKKDSGPGFSKEYLQKVSDGSHPRPLISKEKADELLKKHYSEEVVQETKETPPFDPPYKQVKGDGSVKDKSGAVHTPMSRARDLARRALQKQKEQKIDEAQYAGLEKEDKPGKVKTAIVKTHPKAVESETVEGWKDEKKPVKESYDDEGNLITGKKSLSSFLEALDINLLKAAQKHAKQNPASKDVESERNIHKKYGYRTDKDTHGDDDYDEWGNLKGKAKPSTEKRGRGRPAGSKSGARGPRIK